MTVRQCRAWVRPRCLRNTSQKWILGIANALSAVGLQEWYARAWAYGLLLRTRSAAQDELGRAAIHEEDGVEAVMKCEAAYLLIGVPQVHIPFALEF